MSRYRAQTVAVLVALALGGGAAAFQAPQPPLAPPAGGGAAGVRIKVAQTTTPIKGQAYKFSLCSGSELGAGVASSVCHAAEANGVTGAAGNSIISFKLQNGSFLPPGLHLDGNGVITGTTTADLSKVTVKICAFQIGGIDSNFNCQGQTVGFNGGKVVVMNPPPAAPATPAAPAAAAGGGGPGVGTGLLLGAAGLGGIGAYTYYKNASPDCSGPLNNLNSQALGLQSCGINVNCYNSVIGRMITAGGDFCTCMGATPVDDATKAILQNAFNTLRSLGTNPGSLPSCFR